MASTSIGMDHNFRNRLCYTLWTPFYDVFCRVLAHKRRRSHELLGLQRGDRVLIVGAGTGLDLKLIPPGVEITAIDITPAMIQRLKRRADHLGLEVDARIMDGHALEFPDASFDVVILHLILAVIPDPVRCAREAARVLKSGGRAIVMDKFVRDDRKVSRVLRGINAALRLLGTELTRQLGPLLVGTGLRKVHEEPAGMGGYFKIVLLEKTQGAVPSF